MNTQTRDGSDKTGTNNAYHMAIYLIAQVQALCFNKSPSYCKSAFNGKGTLKVIVY